MQPVVPNALSNRANNCDWIHGREVSSQCRVSATKESTIDCLMNGGHVFFRRQPFLLPVCFAVLLPIESWVEGPWANS